MGEAELLAVPPSFLMDWESHPQLCCCQVRTVLFRLLLLACLYSLPSQHASIRAHVHSFIDSFIQQRLPSACLVPTELATEDTEKSPT